MSLSDYGASPAPPYDMDDDVCTQCGVEPLSRRQEVCTACARQNAADIAEVLDIEGADLCPHCERYAVEEREHPTWCPRSSSRPLMAVVTHDGEPMTALEAATRRLLTGPRCGGAL